MSSDKVDLVTDLSRTICNEQIPIRWILSYEPSFPLFFKSFKNYMRYLVSRDPQHFYSTLKDLPVHHFGFVKELTPNNRWDIVVKVKKPKRIGIITQDDYDAADAYLKTQKQRFEGLGIVEYVILAANHAKHKEGYYTGEVEINVSPNSLLEMLIEHASDIPILGDGPISMILDNCPRQYDNLRRRFINVQQ